MISMNKAKRFFLFFLTLFLLVSCRFSGEENASEPGSIEPVSSESSELPTSYPKDEEGFLVLPEKNYAYPLSTEGQSRIRYAQFVDQPYSSLRLYQEGEEIPLYKVHTNASQTWTPNDYVLAENSVGIIEKDGPVTLVLSTNFALTYGATIRPLSKNVPYSVDKEKRLIALPSIAVFAFFVWIPLIQNITYSFSTDGYYSGFAGLDNYVTIFKDAKFIAALGNTFKYIFYSLLIGFLIPFFLGFMLSEVFHFKGLFRLIIYFPCMLSGIAVVTLFKYFLDPDVSVINSFLTALGFKASMLTSDVDLVIPLIVVAMTWRGAGSTSLIYLSNFQQIDDSLYEAGRIDGAGAWQRFIRITLPQLKATLITLFVLQIISVFQVFYEPWIISGGGPNNASISMMMYAYIRGVTESNIPVGAAAAVVLTIIIIAFTVLYYGIVRLLDKEKRVKKHEKK